MAAARNSIQLSEVYCPSCSDTHVDSPSCLTTISKQKPPEQSKTLLDVESEIEYSKNFNKKLVMTKPPTKNSSNKIVEYEIACEAECDDVPQNDYDDTPVKFGVMTESDNKNLVRVEGKEETPSRLNIKTKKPKPSTSSSPLNLDVTVTAKKNKSRLDFLRVREKKLNKLSNTVNNNETTSTLSEAAKTTSNDSDDNNNSNDDNENDEGEKSAENIIKYSSLPMLNRNSKHKKTISIPQRVAADGTKIFYLCDLPKKLRKGSHSFFSLLFIHSD